MYENFKKRQQYKIATQTWPLQKKTTLLSADCRKQMQFFLLKIPIILLFGMYFNAFVQDRL